MIIRILNGFAESFGYPTLIKMLDYYFCHEVARDFIMTAFGCCKFLGKLFDFVETGAAGKTETQKKNKNVGKNSSKRSSAFFGCFRPPLADTL